MAIQITSTTRPDANSAAEPGLLAEIAEFWRTFIKAAFDPYRPELHYMRGPGPACAEKSGKTNR